MCLVYPHTLKMEEKMVMLEDENRNEGPKLRLYRGENVRKDSRKLLQQEERSYPVKKGNRIQQMFVRISFQT